ncbi:MAG: DNA recombination/repair protein RecA, partial [Lentisphaeria bacterium]|nr:DNA recombination/repair protein RecA [Lentisphaeria bacterium]
MAEKDSAKGKGSAAQKPADGRDKNLLIALEQIEKEYGKGSIMRLGDNKVVDVPVISTG